MNTQKIIISIVLIVSFGLLPKYSFTPEDFQWTSNLLFPLSHANIFHLAGNLLCLWLLKIRLRLPLSWAISFVCSLLPQYSIWGAEPILGFSGILFAAVGIVCGKLGKFKWMMRYCLLPTIIYGMFPHVAMTFHLYTLFLGYGCGMLMSHYSKTSVQ